MVLASDGLWDELTKEDVSIIVSSKDKVKKQKWKLTTYEL